MELTESELQEKIASAVEGLKGKNYELVGAQKALKKKLSAFEGVDLEALAAQSKELTALKEANLSEEDKRNKAVTESASQLKTTQTQLVDANIEIATIKKSGAVTAALAGAGALLDGTSEAVIGLLNSKVTMSDEGVPMIGESTVADHVTKWKAEEGKVFFVPPNSGGGASGGGAEGSEHAKFFEKGGSEYNLTKQAEVAKTNPALYKQLAEQSKHKS